MSFFLCMRIYEPQCHFLLCMRIYEPYGQFLVSPSTLFREACRGMQGITILRPRSPLLVVFFSSGTCVDSLFPLCENCGRIRLVSQLTYINLTILYNKRGCAPFTELILYKPYDTSKGPLLLGQFFELDTRGNEVPVFSFPRDKQRGIQCPTNTC